MKHILLVNRVALFLANKLREKGVDIDIELVDRASLLHDVLKIVDIKDLSEFKDKEFYTKLQKEFKGLDHKDASAKLLTEIGYPEVAKTIRTHGLMSIGEKDGPITWEQKIVFYSDKLAKHDTLATLKERFDEFHKRYTKKNIPDFDIKLRDKKEELTFELEKEIFSYLDFKPEELFKEMIKCQQ